jgi:hypothetical protein
MRLAKEAKSNPKCFYNYMQSKTTFREAIGELTSDAGIPVTTDIDKAVVLLEHFQKVHVNDTFEESAVHEMPMNEREMAEISVTESEVSKQLSKLSKGKAPGPDDIPPELLKILNVILAEPLARLFNQSLREGKLPVDWKTATIKPIHKGGNKSVPANYRPVSLTSSVLKVLERLIRDKVAFHLTENRLLSASQHGFMKRRS